MLTTIDKAIAAGFAAAVLAFGTAYSTGDADLKTALIAAVGGFVVGVLTWLVRNKAA